MKPPDNAPLDTYWPSEKAQKNCKALRDYAEDLRKELNLRPLPPPPSAMRALGNLRAQELRKAALEKIRSGGGGSFCAPPEFYRRRAAEGKSVDPDPGSTGARLQEADRQHDEAKPKLVEMKPKKRPRKDVLAYKHAVPVRVRQRRRRK